MANGYTNKGVKWELFQSIWVLFVFTPFGFLNWVSFFYIFARAKQKKWLIAGWIYFAIFLFTILSNGTPPCVKKSVAFHLLIISANS